MKPTKKQIAEKIGVSDSTMRKWAPSKRDKWRHLAESDCTQYTATYFDLLNQLAFAVAALSAANGRYSASLHIGATTGFMVHDHLNIANKPAESIVLYCADDIVKALKALEKYHD